ncbi:hypothetical protein BDW02DRAFT_632985 [Decorospora gaudefroyi]|uniref:Uncharacterized protein n=1 Tax=Decorospora gaudefroyi TaxID=184978 RepID=A0A6A5K9C5_9PLEO|nr:hypothetical protein BDW02DRAFT_632985 [Decorospora gaudefroyi]
MLRASDYYARTNQVRRNPQRGGPTRHSRDLAFLDQPRYYETKDSSSSESVVSERYQRRYESDELSSEADSELVEEMPVQAARKYYLYAIVASMAIAFLFEIPVDIPRILAFFLALIAFHVVRNLYLSLICITTIAIFRTNLEVILLRIPFLFAFVLAIPCVYLLFTPESVASKLNGTAFHSEQYDDSEPEALYRRHASTSAYAGMPGTESTLPGTLVSMPINYSGTTTFFNPSTHFARATDPDHSTHRRRTMHTNLLEPRFQPRRTFGEAWADTWPRVLRRWTAFVLRHLTFQLRFRIFVMVVQIFRGFWIDDVGDSHEYFTNVWRFYYDWVVGLSGLVWQGVKGLGKAIWAIVLKGSTVPGQYVRGRGEYATDAWGNPVHTMAESAGAFWSGRGYQRWL